jgi:hypothetical protein
VNEITLAGRIRAIERALSGVDHAFGGALALAYYAEPRATIDIDLNVFVRPDRMSEAIGPLTQLGVETDDPTLHALIFTDGQARVMWDSVPVDLFFAYDPVHEAMAAGVRRVPFGDESITILAPEHLIICKVVFNRPKDWVDIDAMLATEVTVDTAEVLRWVGRLVGDDDKRYDRIAALLTGRPVG